MLNNRSSFFKDAATLTAGTTIAQIVPILVYPILSRIYSPEAFAALATFTAIINILQVLVTCKYEDGIFVSKSDKEAASLVLLVLLINVVVGLLAFIFFLLCGNFLGQSIASLRWWLLITPLVAIFVGVYNVYNEWCVKYKFYKKLSYNKIVYSFSTTIGKLLCSIGSIRHIGLLLGDIIGKFLTACVCIFKVYRQDGSVFKEVSFRDIKTVAQNNRNFPFYILPAQLLNTLGGSLPVLLLGVYYTETQLGFFSMTTMVLSIPISIISYSIRDVFRQKANEEYQRKGEFRALFNSLFYKLSLATFVCCFIVVWFLPWLFKMVLGGQWIVAGEYAQILLPMIAVDFVAMSLSGVFIVVNKLQVQLVWQIIYCITTVIALIIGGLYINDIKLTLSLFSGTRVLVYGLMIGLSAYYSRGIKK